jgi:hypothetical protein
MMAASGHTQQQIDQPTHLSTINTYPATSLAAAMASGCSTSVGRSGDARADVAAEVAFDLRSEMNGRLAVQYRR